ncbi:hypothetical protein [Metabacillus lacus]|uniref:hypothetical protein n=1 Tax=Metabacillus lacus TaxID=1983721 RepID=UPI003CCCFC64
MYGRVLKRFGLTEHWLHNEIAHSYQIEVEEIFYASYTPELKRLHISLNNAEQALPDLLH